MSKTLTKVGNSQAVIIPKALIHKYGLDTVNLIEKEEGILIVPDSKKVSFQEKVEKLKSRKNEVYRRMKEQSEDPLIIDYYENQSLEEIDLDIID